jgi:magnesium transporter
MDNLYVNEILELFDLNLENDVFKERILEYHPYELSEAIVEMNEDQRAFLFGLLGPSDISYSIAHLEVEDAIEMFNEMKPRYIVNIIQELEMDDAVDLMLALPEEERAGYLKLMDQEHRAKIKDFFKYQEDTAGSIMTTEYIELSVKDTVEGAMRKLINQAVEASTIYTLYVVDDKNILVGTLSLREMILARKGEKISEIMNQRVISVKTGMDQEAVADIAMDYDFTSIPVVDHLNRMLGVITIDDIIDVIEEEAVEDYSRLAAISDVEIDSETETIWMSARKRLPWLLVLTILGFLTSTIIAQFEGTLDQVPTIALFMPMILGMAGNTGTQSLAVTIRGLNDGEFDSKTEVVRHLIREVGTGLVNGLLIGIILFIVTFGFLSITGNGDIAFQITQAVSLSILVSLTFATLAGALIPIIINSFKIDPAVASGPFVTMVIDLIALSVYFFLATILIINTL